MGHEDDFGGVFSPTLQDDLEGFAFNELYEEIEAVVARVCRPCLPELVS
jgi:hypothetical protein